MCSNWAELILHEKFIIFSCFAKKNCHITRIYFFMVNWMVYYYNNSNDDVNYSEWFYMFNICVEFNWEKLLLHEIRLLASCIMVAIAFSATYNKFEIINFCFEKITMQVFNKNKNWFHQNLNVITYTLHGIMWLRFHLEE